MRLSVRAVNQFFPHSLLFGAASPDNPGWPRRQPACHRVAMPHDDSDGLFGLEGRRLLVVEDNHDCAEAVQRWLEICGARVTLADSVGGALARVRRRAPDLMLVDGYLPDGTGWDLLERMRATVPGTRQVPVVAITGAPPASIEPAARAYGVRHVLAKPIAPEALAAALTDCLDAAA
jgi:CheY-like chemotaxis protein